MYFIKVRPLFQIHYANYKSLKLLTLSGNVPGLSGNRIVRYINLKTLTKIVLNYKIYINYIHGYKRNDSL